MQRRVLGHQAKLEAEFPRGEDNRIVLLEESELVVYKAIEHRS